MVEKHDRHLGLPATVGKSMKEIFGFFEREDLETHQRVLSGVEWGIKT